MSEQAMKSGVDLNIFLSEKRQHAPSLRQVAGEGGWDSVTDVCYLSNKFFPTPEILGLLQEQIPYVIKAYPSMQSYQVRFVSQLSGVDETLLAVGNGGSEVIVILGEVWASVI